MTSTTLATFFNGLALALLQGGAFDSLPLEGSKGEKIFDSFSKAFGILLFIALFAWVILQFRTGGRAVDNARNTRPEPLPARPPRKPAPTAEAAPPEKPNGDRFDALEL